ncbi:MAG: hypothetical protein WC723_03850 [Candidatus Omnitrophota bacterium]
MAKKKISIGYRVLHLFTYHPWLKFISLVLAMVVWLYIREEIARFNY